MLRSKQSNGKCYRVQIYEWLPIRWSEDAIDLISFGSFPLILGISKKENMMKPLEKWFN